MKLLLLTLFLSFSTQSMASGTFDYRIISNVPILSEGRIKPLDTFARSTLLSLHNKSSLKKHSAIEWIIEVLFDQKAAYNQPIFKIVNDDVLKALDLNKSDFHNYTFIDLYTAFQKNGELVSELNKKDPDELEPSQKQIVELYQKLLSFLDISRSFSLISPEIEVPEETIRTFLGLSASGNTTYLELTTKKDLLKRAASESLKVKDEKSNSDLKRIAYILRHLDLIKDDSFSSQLKILPMQDHDWMSMWQIDLSTKIIPQYEDYMRLWASLYLSYKNKSPDDFNRISQEIVTYADQFLVRGPTTPGQLKAETLMNRLDLLYKAIALYILGFILLCISFVYAKRFLRNLSFASLIIGSGLHLIHITLRCFILNRPPVSNLYESTIFVALVAVVFSVIFEFRRRDGLGTLVGTLLGSILLFVGFGYQKDGDTLGMLVAVLDTNFWLATHVVTISIGYGYCLVASLLAHLYLIQSLKPKNADSLPGLEKNIHGSVLFSLFFTVLGTILGGIWADQSWGRFWGWDPKENGALLICLWLIWVVHGRLCGKLKNRLYAAAVTLTSVIVVIAWFGVNLLSVGLHSYGFTDNIAHNILYFSLAEIVFLMFILIRLSITTKEVKA